MRTTTRILTGSSRSSAGASVRKNDVAPVVVKVVVATKVVAAATVAAAVTVAAVAAVAVAVVTAIVASVIDLRFHTNDDTMNKTTARLQKRAVVFVSEQYLQAGYKVAKMG